MADKSTGDEKMNQLVSELKNVEKSYLLLIIFSRYSLITSNKKI